MRIKKILRIAAPVLVIVGGIAVVQVLNATKPEPEKTNEEPRPVALFVDQVKETDLALKVSTHGEIRAKTEIQLTPQVAGRIVYVSEAFTRGARVKAGETLVQIDDTDYKARLARAEAQVADARVKLLQTEGSAQVARRQWDSSVGGDPSALALKEPQVAQARAALQAAEADLEMARVNLERTKISVPFDGIVAEKAAGLGQFVGMGTPLGRVFSTDKVEVSLPLSDQQFASLGLPLGYEAQSENAPQVTFTAVVAGEIRNWQGSIVRTSGAVDSETRLVYAIAEVEDPYGAGAEVGGMPLAVGLFVNAEIEGRDMNRAQVLPRAALRGADKVYVVDADGIMSIREVEIAYSDPERVVVKGGVVRAGEQVVVSSVRSPADGMKVRAIQRGEAPTLSAAAK